MITMKNELKIYHLIDGKKELVNTIEIADVNLTLAQLFKATKLYGYKVKMNRLSYEQDWFKITEKFDKDRFNLSKTTIYEYILNLEGI